MRLAYCLPNGIGERAFRYKAPPAREGLCLTRAVLIE